MAPNRYTVGSEVMIFYVIASIVASVANYISYKQLLNHFRSSSVVIDGKTTEHNYEFFVTQCNTIIYVIFSTFVVGYKALSVGPRAWFRKQDIPWHKFAIMGFLDASSGFLSSMGGAYTDGGLQNLLNQCAIPGTMVMSYFFLGEIVNRTQTLGSGAIILGTAVSILPAILDPSSHSTTTVAGVIIYFIGIIPTSASNVYKEAAFRTGNELHVDIYLLSAIVAVFQVIFGFMFIPILALPGFGGLPLAEIPNQLRYGFACFLGENSLPGDHCGYKTSWLKGSTAAMFIYCFINFGYNVLSLLVTKYGSATLMVVSAALALPITNIAFASRFFMGSDAETFSDADIVALVIVVLGFILYSSDGLSFSPSDDDVEKDGHKHHIPKGLMFPFRGSMVPLQRSNSDPNMFWSPEFTPKNSSSRFGRYSPSSRLMQKSPSLSKQRPQGTPKSSSSTPTHEVQYNALSTTPPLNVLRNGGSGDDYGLEMRPGYEASSL